MAVFNVEVVKVAGARYAVQVSYLPARDEMFEIITHAARFKTETAAKSFSTRIKRAGWDNLNLDHWLWCPSRCSPFARLQNWPTAKAYNVDR